eukprot:686678-Pleurochrysis_carterae.AAC.3
MTFTLCHNACTSSRSALIVYLFTCSSQSGSYVSSLRTLAYLFRELASKSHFRPSFYRFPSNSIQYRMNILHRGNQMRLNTSGPESCNQNTRLYFRQFKQAATSPFSVNCKLERTRNSNWRSSIICTILILEAYNMLSAKQTGRRSSRPYRDNTTHQTPQSRRAIATTPVAASSPSGDVVLHKNYYILCNSLPDEQFNSPKYCIG